MKERSSEGSFFEDLPDPTASKFIGERPRTKD
jgi:hypothetical protein